jgi:hypothetical protein
MTAPQLLFSGSSLPFFDAYGVGPGRHSYFARRPWSPAEVDLLAAMYPDCHSADVGAWLDRPTGQVYRAAARHGLHKSAEYLASDTACRIQRGKQHPSMIASRFQKGLEPWNKGTHYVAGGRSAETRFKPGRRPEHSRNYRPIGSLRITRDGSLERKVTDDQSVYPARRWVSVARLVWEAERGSITAGHLVAFKPGMHTTKADELTVERLECITRGENARRNHPRSKSPELARLVQLKGAITRQVNRISREAQERT